MKKTASDPAAAATALVQLLPTPAPLKVVLHSGTPDAVPDAVAATFVGATSADLAVTLLDSEALTAASGSDSPLVTAVDVLRPALEGAAGVLGIGVLGETRLEDASALFTDPETSVFELKNGSKLAGWFAIRLRPGSTGSTGRAAAGRTERSMAGKLARINNVEMALTVEIGHTRMSVRDVLDLEPGAVIELDRSAGAPADVLLNGRLIAHGEVVVVDQDYAVRITQILDVDDGLAL